jgi:hypothetical protein
MRAAVRPSREALGVNGYTDTKPCGDDRHPLPPSLHDGFSLVPLRDNNIVAAERSIFCA